MLKLFYRFPSLFFIMKFFFKNTHLALNDNDATLAVDTNSSWMLENVGAEFAQELPVLIEHLKSNYNSKIYEFSVRDYTSRKIKNLSMKNAIKCFVYFKLAGKSTRTIFKIIIFTWI